MPFKKRSYATANDRDENEVKSFQISELFQQNVFQAESSLEEDQPEKKRLRVIPQNAPVIPFYPDNTALHEYFLIGPASIEEVKMLLNNEASLDAKDEEGDTPLHVAILTNQPVEVIRLLLEAKAPLEAEDEDGDTPLHAAIRTSQPGKVIKLFLEAQAPLNAKNATGDTPLHAAVRVHFPSVEVVQMLLEAHASVNAINEEGNTPLHIAVSDGSTPLEAVKLLLEANSSLDAVNKEGNTPLHLAMIADSPSLDAIKLLLEKGADPDQINNNGESSCLLSYLSGLNISLESKNLIYNIEYLYRLLLSNSWSIKHKSVIDREVVKFFIGSYSKKSGVNTTQSLFELFLSHPLLKFNLRHFQELYTCSLKNAEGSFTIIQDRYKAGESFCFMTGWEKHAFFWFFMGIIWLWQIEGKEGTLTSLGVLK